MRQIYVSLYIEDQPGRVYLQRRVALRVEEGTSMRDAAKRFRKDEARMQGGIVAKRPSLLKIEIETEIPFVPIKQ